MIEHPILAFASQKEKTSNVWLANLFVLWATLTTFVRPKNKKLQSNPNDQSSDNNKPVDIPVIHPEYYMGHRGDERISKHLRFAVNLVEKNTLFSSGFFDNFFEKMFEKTKFGSTNDKNRLKEMLATIFESFAKIKQSNQIYAFGKDFFTALASIKNDIPLDILPTKKFYAYFAFPHQDVLRLLSDGTRAVGATVAFEPSSEGDGAGVVVMVHSDENGDASMMGEILSTFLLKNEDGKLMIDSDTSEAVAIIINMIAYIKSAQPDVSWLQPKAGLTTKKIKELKTKGTRISSRITVPIRLVSWNWLKPIKYTTNEWLRKMHMRWQRFGPQNSLVKLIWIDETVIHRKVSVKGEE